jgi:hypothetical protein
MLPQKMPRFNEAELATVQILSNNDGNDNGINLSSNHVLNFLHFGEGKILET